MKQAIVVVSFGTSVPEARNSIEAVETALKQISGRDFFRAFTSPTIRRILQKRGEHIEGLEETLGQLVSTGYEDVVVQPTHLLYGIEYDKIQDTVNGFRERFRKICLGKPLLADADDLLKLADGILESYPPGDGALVLMGHGTAHFANMTYPAFQTALRLRGGKNAFVGTVEGWPGLDEVIVQLKDSGVKKVQLVPLMLVAGDHAKNDMAGEDGWSARLQTEGFQVSCRMNGLGELSCVQRMYAQRLSRLLEGSDGV